MRGPGAAAHVRLLGLRADEGRRVDRVLSRSLFAEGSTTAQCTVKTQLLARADVRRLKPLMQSLLVFRKDAELGPGQMKVEEGFDSVHAATLFEPLEASESVSGDGDDE